MKPFYSKVVLAVLASVCLGGISRAGVLEQKLASLPVFDELASVKTPFDWLVSPEKSAAGVDVGLIPRPEGGGEVYEANVSHKCVGMGSGRLDSRSTTDQIRVVDGG